MKTKSAFAIALLLCLFTTMKAWADPLPIPPEESKRGATRPIISCDFIQNDLEFTRWDIQANGDLYETTNKKYQPSSRYYVFRGLTVNSSASEIRVRGLLSTMYGSYRLDVIFPRRVDQPKAQLVMGSNAICKVH